MNTQLLLKLKPNRANILDPYTPVSEEFLPVNDDLTKDLSSLQGYAYRPSINPNWTMDVGSIRIKGTSTRLVNIDLFEDTAIPLNFTILDVREPEKRKTNFSKTIRLPGTKNNNRLFNHVYEISGNSKFNPNLRTEVIVQQDGVQIIRGNMQLKRINVFNDNDVEYEVIITGDFTSLFADIGLAKLSDLDFSEYNHTWNRTNIVNSWNNNVQRDGQLYSAKEIGDQKFFTDFERDFETGRIMLTTTTPHGLQEGDWIRIFPDENDFGHEYVYGEWQVAEIKSSLRFTINHPYPDGLYGSSGVNGYIRKWQPTGEGYVYSMISWGDDTIIPNPVNNQSVLPTFPVTNFVMGFYVKEIWDKIFKETNSRYESEFLNSDFFKRLTIFQKKTQYDLQKSEIQSREYKVANTTQHSLRVAGFGSNNTGGYPGQYRSYPFNNTYYQPYQFNANISASNGILYNGIEGTRPFKEGVDKWVVTDSGNYDVNFSIVFQLRTQISSYDTTGTFNPPRDESGYNYYWGGDSDETTKEDVEVYVKMIKISNGMATVLTQEFLTLTRTDGNLDTPTKTTFRDWTWQPKQATLSLTDQFFKKDDEIYIEISHRSLFNNNTNGTFMEVKFEPGVPGGQQPSPPRWIRTPYRGIVDIKTVGTQYFFNKANPTIVEGSEVFTEQFLPKDMSCKDFLISIIRMFNLHIESDKEIENYYYIEPRNDYYKDGSGGLNDYVDWTEKVDINSIQLTPMGELNAKFYNFTYKQDNDYWNKKYLEDAGIGYGSYIKEIENDFLSNEQKIETKFGATVMINSPSDSDIVIPQVVQKDNNNQNKVTNTAAKILIWGGPRPTSSNGVPQKWQLERTIIENPDDYDSNDDLFRFYPYAGTVDSPLDPLQDLNWFYTDYVYWNRARWTNDNLYNKYWAGFIEEISDPDSKLINASLKLQPKDIYELDFKKIYVINGHYLRLQKISDYNANGDELTKCEFLKLKSPSKFKRRSIQVDEDFIRDDININFPTNVFNKPPQNYVDRYPLSNYSESAFSGVFNANLNGQNNIISKNANNISIQGNENFIGGKSSNISINGNGVQVAGGLKNVNVIGTDNIFVEESNVTYINGIRYKNGVAISKSNVVNGAINSATGNISINTTPNVIDAGEDIVITPGSATYEDVVNAGQDRILPDLANFNVSTQNTARPSTNFSGVAITKSGLTYSLPQLIEQRIDPVPYSAFNSYPSS